MNSQGHRENILRPEFREIGFGVVLGNPRATDGQGATYTTNFGAVSGGTANASVSRPAGTTASTTNAVQRTATTAAVHAHQARLRRARHELSRHARALRRARAAAHRRHHR